MIAMKGNFAKNIRLRHIEQMLKHYGHLNRSALQDYFGVGPATATRDIKDYKALAPGNMRFSVTSKRYNATEAFTPIFEDDTDDI